MEQVAQTPDDSSDFGGQTPIVRELSAADLPKLRRLIASLNWNQLDDEWIFMLEHAPETVLGMFLQDRVIGTAAALPYANDVAWVNMVTVEPGVKSGGVVERLLRELLTRRDGLPFMLDAAPEGVGLYRKFGFEEVGRTVRLTGRGGGRCPRGVSVVTADDLPELVRADAESFGARRPELLRWLLRRGDRTSFRLPQAQAFLLSRPGRLFRQLGPLYAPDLDGALCLLETALSRCANEFPMIDVPETQRQFVAALERRGFVVQKSFFRMSLNGGGDRVKASASCYAIAGPEFG